MLGQMMHRPLSIIEILRYGAETHKTSEIVSVRTEGDIHRYTYREAYQRVAQVAHALKNLGLKWATESRRLHGMDIAILNSIYAIAGIGGVCHTINPRLSAEQMIYIIQHAEDKVLCLDLTFVPLVEALAEHLPANMTYILMTDRANMPESKVNFYVMRNWSKANLKNLIG